MTISRTLFRLKFLALFLVIFQAQAFAAITCTKVNPGTGKLDCTGFDFYQDDCSSKTQDGASCWDKDGDLLYVGTGAGVVSIVAGGLTSTNIDTSAELRAILTDENGTGALLFDGATSASFTTPVLGAATFTSLTGSNGESINNTGATDSIDFVGANTLRFDLDSQSISDAVSISVTNGSTIEIAETLNIMSSLALTFRDNGNDRSTSLNMVDNGNFVISTSSGDVTINEIVTLGATTATSLDLTSGTIALADGGLGVSLADPGADGLLFWDDSAGAVAFMTLGASLELDVTGLILNIATPIGFGDGGTGGTTRQSGLDLITDADTATAGWVLMSDGTNASFQPNVSSLFTDSTTPLYVTDTGEDVVIGGNAVVGGSKLSVIMTDDQTGLALKMNASQTANPFRLVASDDSDQLVFTPTGGITSTPTGGGHALFTITGATSVTTDAAGELAFDTDAQGSGRGSLEVYDGTASTYVVGILASDTCTNGQAPIWNTGGTWTCETLSRPNSALSDDTFSGTTISLTAGENIVIGSVCYMKSDGKAWKADADAIATAGALFISTATISADAAGIFGMDGLLRDDSGYALTVGGLVYLSTTAGEITQTAPSGADDVIQVLGVAVTADILYFRPSLVQVEHT